jgi:hypothetical protein
MFPNKVTRYELNPSCVDCLVFCSKDYRPILPYIGKIAETFPIYCHYTITAYGRDVEPGVPSISQSIETLIELSKIVGREKIAWRYDPVLLTESYTIERHLETFSQMAKQITPWVSRCIFSFVEMYKKLKTNMPEIILLTPEDKQRLAQGMGAIAEENGLWLQTCATDENFEQFGIHASGCMTLEILGAANGLEFRKLKHKGMRKGCHCIESRGLGSYDTCPNGCKYCYANKSMDKVRENLPLHDPESPLLIGHLKPTDILQQGSCKSLLAKKHQPTLFD